MDRINQQVQAVANGDMTAVEATTAAIERIEAGDGDLNAVVVRDFDRALDAAADVDRRRAAGERPPLLGLPMTVKESFDVAGMPTTWGMEANRDHVAEVDAEVVRRLKDAGAVIVGKTNVPPMLADHLASNPVYGVTHNPHAHGRSPGGSSGGAAAAVAAGFVTAEVGSDIGGSIRIPASFCGVWGLKPTFDLVSKQGHSLPGIDGHGDALSVAGPIAGSAADLDLLLGVLAQHPLAPPVREDPTGLRVAVVVDAAEEPVAREVRAVVDAISARFEAAGATVDAEPELPSMIETRDAYRPLLETILVAGYPLPGQEPMTVRGWFDLLDAQARIRRRWSAVLSERYDVVLMPIYSTPAFPNDDLDIITRVLEVDGEATPNVQQLTWASLPILTGMPAVAFPAGTSADGLPIGLQLIGRHFTERDLLQLATFVAEPAALLG